MNLCLRIKPKTHRSKSHFCLFSNDCKCGVKPLYFTVQMQKSKALIYEFKTDPAIPTADEDKEAKIRVGVVDEVFGMARLDDTLRNGEAIFLRFDYTDHLHVTHQCGAEMRLRMRKRARSNRIEQDGQWLELKCWRCHSDFVPYRQVSDMDLSPKTPTRREKTPIRLRTDVCGFNALFRLAGYDRVIDASQHLVSTIEDDRFGISPTRIGIVKIQVDQHGHIAFVHEPCGRKMGVKVTHTVDSYAKDYIWVSCRCKRLRYYTWLRKVVTIRPQDREREVQRNKPTKEPTTPIDWNDAVSTYHFDAEPDAKEHHSSIVGYVVRALRDLRDRVAFEVDDTTGYATWYRHLETRNPWVQCTVNRDGLIEVPVHVKDRIKTHCFDVHHKDDAAAFIRQILTTTTE